MNKVYKVKYQIKVDDFIENGYDLMPFDIVEKDNVVFKIMKMDYDSDPVKHVISIYNNKSWQDEFLSLEGAEEIYNSLGIFWEDVVDEEGNVKKLVSETEDFMDMISTWRIEIDLNKGEDRYVGFTTGDMSFPYTFYKKELLDNYCSEEIERLFELGFIKIENIKE